MTDSEEKEAFEVRELCQTEETVAHKGHSRRILHSSHIHSSIQNITLGPKEMRGGLL